MSALIAYQWDGEAMKPLHRFRKECDREFVIGETYLLEPVEERSGNSHRHFFAAVRESWMNLPHELAHEFPTPDALRKHALIRTGFCDSRSVVCRSNAEARKVAGFAEDDSDYCIVVVNGATVTKLKAKSQSMRAMGKDEFQRSKDAVLDFLASMLGTDTPSLTSSARAA